MSAASASTATIERHKFQFAFIARPNARDCPLGDGSLISLSAARLACASTRSGFNGNRFFEALQRLRDAL